MCPPEKVNQATTREWRELGFYYEFVQETSRWILVGSKSGLQKFAHLIAEFASNPQNQRISEHLHLGPYMYFEIMTWSEPKITSHALCGSLPDLRRLAEIITEALLSAQVEDRITIDSQYSNNNEAILVLEVRPEEFDPASADTELQSNQ